MRIAEAWSGRVLLFGAAALLASAGIAVTELVDRATAPDTIEVHVELRSEAAHVEGETPLFTHLAPGDHDDRRRWVRLDVPATELAARMAELAADPDVEEAFVAPEVTLPSAIAGDACPITTPSFESYQGYLGPAPHGIDAPAAWSRGLRGQGVQFADIEGGWNAAHEDLPGDRITHVAGKPIKNRGWREHGTAVLGEVVGKPNALGVVGIAPDVDRIFTVSIGGLAVADALDAAANKLRAGDVMLIELQGTGPRGRFLPMEYWDDNYAAIRRATDRGVVVIEAAGNGGEDLDHKAYGGKLDRKKRDSGAIVVGAGGPPRPGFIDRARLDFSNYGTRVDVQGWGRKVATLDYGDLQACDDPGHRHYTGEFGGTSSASPIVAGAAILVETATNRGLAPRAVRDLLAKTGTPQEGDKARWIGPRPDLARALGALSMVR